MIEQQFLASRLGRSALISVAAMLAFNCYALAQPEARAAELQLAAVHTAELA